MNAQLVPLLVLSLDVAVPQCASQPDSAGYVRIVGGDTLSVETVVTAEDVTRGEFLALDGGHITYALDLRDHPNASTLTLELHMAGTESDATQRATLRLSGRVASLALSAPQGMQYQQDSTPRGAIPVIQGPFGLVACIVNVARRAGAPEVDVPLFFAGTAGWTPSAKVTFVDQRARTIVIDEFAASLETDSVDRITAAHGLSQPTEQGVKIVRISYEQAIRWMGEHRARARS